MADRRVTFLIGANVKNFTRGLNKAQRKFRSFGRKLERTGQTLTRSLTVPMAAVGGLALKAAADFETLQVQLNTLTGSAEAGAKAFENLKEFSARTPFQLKDLAKANNTLLGFGLNAEDAFKHLQTLGDAAAVTGGDLQAISVAFGQAAAEGRLMTRDIRQLINQGVPAIKLLADSMGVAQSDVLDLASAGEITFPKLVKAMEDATEAGGMFANGTEKLSQTLGGLFSTLRDRVNIALAELGATIDETFNIKGLIKSVGDSIQQAVTYFNSLSPEVRRMALTIAALLGPSGPIMIALGTLSAAIGAISLPITATVAAVGVGVTMMIKHWDKIVAYFEGGAGAEMWENLKETAQDTFEVLTRVWKSFVGAITRIWDLFGEDIINAVTGIFKVLKGSFEYGLNLIMIVLDTFTGRWLTDWDGYLEDTKESFANIFGEGGALSTILDGFFTMFLSRAKEIPSLFGKLVIDEKGMRWVTNAEAAAKALEWQRKAAKRAGEGMMLYKDSLMGLPSVLDNVFGAASGQGPLLPAGGSSEVDTGGDTGGDSGGSAALITTNPIEKASASIKRLSGGVQKAKSDFSDLALTGSKGMSVIDIVTAKTKQEMARLAAWTNIVNDITNRFVDSFGRGMANVVVQGEKIVDVLNNIGKLLLSSAIQQGLKLLMSGGLSGVGGFFGSGGGLFGAIGGILGFADGGRPPVGIPSIVGERGPELFVPDRPGTIIPNNMLTSSSGGGRQVIHNKVYLDGKQIWSNQKEVGHRVGR